MDYLNELQNELENRNRTIARLRIELREARGYIGIVVMVVFSIGGVVGWFLRSLLHWSK